ncbi:MAG: thiamine phosphate synthase [Verrucomicrobia bacterium]|nr:thiamine phosphate synthase [Verrucomicrobiota bacterium]
MKRTPDYSVYLVTDRSLAGGRSLASVVQAALDGGAGVVQIREKNLSSRAFYERAVEIVRLVRPMGRAVIVNDRLDIAMACGADGVHLGQADLPCEAARRLGGPGWIVGVSVGTEAEAVAAERAGADYLGISPVFATPTKPDAPEPAGLAGLQRIRRVVRLPLVAIGGIHAGNAADVIRAGADGVAVVSAVMAASDPRAATAALMKAVMTGRQLETMIVGGSER